ncbi:propanoyl-CoA acyltransferase [Bordetella sp. H567]|uniref:thiolase family protein n=1 Tax=Bordetella sp. H567 TaxID=1697043 RepID=UPI00081D2254|nr:thiolase family protein [Bordetella sp. H567]AOB30223.1 propanoyl-CoA acyltransferase [Bordetella sp. H567]
MRKVSVIGTGMIKFGKYPDVSLADLGWPAVKQAIADAGIEPRDIDALFCGTGLGGPMPGQRIFGRLGLAGLPIINVENACSSGSSALSLGYTAIASGRYDIVMAMGVEKLTKFNGGTIPLEREDWEVANGLVMPALYAMRARRYMHDYGLTREQLASVVVKSRRHAALNHDAQLRKETTVEEVLASRMIADPFTLYQCCPTGDGAAVVILCAEELAPKYCSRPVKVVASHVASGVFESGPRDMTNPEITVRCARETYEEAGLGPEDIDVAEVHDAFTSAELMYYEAFGFCERGEAAQLLESGATSLGGRIPVNPSGGLLSKGHPVAATGAAQVVEVVRQLQGRCGSRQVEGAKVGLTHATGGGISGFDHGVCAIHVFAV